MVIFPNAFLINTLQSVNGRTFLYNFEYQVYKESFHLFIPSFLHSFPSEFIWSFVQLICVCLLLQRCTYVKLMVIDRRSTWANSASSISRDWISCCFQILQVIISWQRAILVACWKENWESMLTENWFTLVLSLLLLVHIIKMLWVKTMSLLCGFKLQCFQERKLTD